MIWVYNILIHYYLYIFQVLLRCHLILPPLPFEKRRAITCSCRFSFSKSSSSSEKKYLDFFRFLLFFLKWSSTSKDTMIWDAVNSPFSVFLSFHSTSVSVSHSAKQSEKERLSFSFTSLSSSFSFFSTQLLKKYSSNDTNSKNLFKK